MQRGIDTKQRQRIRKCNDRANKNLVDRGWIFDGLWWYSPYTGFRYLKREATYVEELRAWSESNSAFLQDKDHSRWVQKEEDDNVLITMEELSRKSQERIFLRDAATRSNLGGKKVT